MLDKLKEFLAAHKVTVTLVGGAVILATAYGTCTYEPASVSASDGAEATIEVSTVATEPSTVTGSTAATTDATSSEGTQAATESANE